MKFDFPEEITSDLLSMMLGRKLGSGLNREVYEYKLDSDYVVKIELDSTENHSFQNVEEYNAWCEVRFTKFAKWFAPCKTISNSGKILIQRRVYPIMPESIETHYPKAEMPKKIPYFFTDIKRSTFGWMDGKFVCCDYGLNLLRTWGLTNKMQINPLLTPHLATADKSKT